MEVGKIGFRESWWKISCSLFGEKEGKIVYEQYRNYALQIWCNENNKHVSPHYDFPKIMQVFDYLNYYTSSAKISVFYIPYPLIDNNLAKLQKPEDFYFERKQFYANNGEATLQRIEDGEIKNATYELLFSENVFDFLDTEIKNNLHNLSFIATSHSRKMEQIFKSFRESYRAGYRGISQRDFLEYIEQKIKIKASDHDLRYLWKSFYNGELDLEEESEK